MKVSVFVEGGGPYKSGQEAAKCREGFRIFLQRALGDGPKPKVVACGSRDQAYHDFQKSLKSDSDIFALLLVDAEDPVTGSKTASAHLQDRDSHWKLIPDGQAHLMVQCMESWFLADKKVLVGYYREGFKEQALPKNPNIEEIAKSDVMNGLEAATKGTTKGKYHKTRHGFDILGLIDPNKVTGASPFADDLIKTLREKLSQ